jgi:hypothetical protein
VTWSPNKLWRSPSIFNLWGAVRVSRNFLHGQGQKYDQVFSVAGNGPHPHSSLIYCRQSSTCYVNILADLADRGGGGGGFKGHIKISWSSYSCFMRWRKNTDCCYSWKLEITPCRRKSKSFRITSLQTTKNKNAICHKLELPVDQIGGDLNSK